MRYNSPHWDLANGVCRIHFLAMLPCPACIAECHPDLEAILEPEDQDVLDFTPELTARDLLPVGNQVTIVVGAS